MKTTSPGKGKKSTKHRREKKPKNYAIPPNMPKSTTLLLWFYFQDPNTNPGLENEPLTLEEQKIYDNFYAYLQSVGLDPVRRPTQENQGDDAPKRTIYVRVFIQHYEAIRKKGWRMGLAHATVREDPFEEKEKNHGPAAFLPSRIQGLEPDA